MPGRSYPNGAHVAEVEVDPETGEVEVLAYTVTDDFGNMINPRLVEGQVHGGVAQGLGQALTERVVYDADGQLLTATFMDYAHAAGDDVADDPLHHRADALDRQHHGHEGLRRGRDRRLDGGRRQCGAWMRSGMPACARPTCRSPRIASGRC